jgi:hypothetical protein
MRNFAGGAAIAVLALAAAPSAFAQATTGGVSGRVTNDQGQPVAGATVTVTHVPTGSTTTTVTDGQGAYTVLNQRVGGPYKVTVKAKGYNDEAIDVATVGIGDPTAGDVIVHSGAAVKEVTVTGQRAKGATSPRTRIANQEIQTLPSLARDLKDFARKSPYVVLDPSNSNALIIGGQNNRTNTITIDGVKQTDTFGLNGNGYPTLHSPISLSVVQTLQVEVAPYDVIYGDFQGGTVNVVTKSGTNEFHGEAFYEYDNNHLRGSSFFAPGAATQTNFTSGFSEKTWGVTLGGPIWKDHAFFLLNYENFTSTSPTTTGPIDGGTPNPVPGITVADVNTVRALVKQAYGYDPLSWQVSSAPIHDHKFFGKLDWNIVEGQRLVFEYQKTDGGSFNTTGAGSNSCSTSIVVATNNKPCISLESKDYTLQTNFEQYKVQLFSRWTDAFTTELSASHQEADNISTPATSPFPEMQVFLPNYTTITNGVTNTYPVQFAANGTPVCGTPGANAPTATTTPCPSIVFGTDISRQANVLRDKIDQFRIKGDYRWNGHTFTAGYELQKIDIFNLFIQRAIGQYVFNCEMPTGGGFTCNDTKWQSALSDGVAYQLQYSNAASNNSADGAAAFKFDQHTAYIQDEWQVLSNLTVRGGLRYDFYTSDSLPKLNPAFGAAYGFPNNKNLDGMHVLQPRIGFNWRPLPKTQVYGGYGLFQGGSPLVWISNSYSNPGNLTGFVSCNRNSTLQTPPAVPSAACVSSLNLPLNSSGVYTAPAGAGAQSDNSNSANAGTGNANAIMPGTEPASIWKASIGVRREFDLSWLTLGDYWHANAEYVDSQTNKALFWQDVYMAQFKTGTAPDGRPTYGPTTASGQPIYGLTTRQNRTDVALLNTDKGFSDQWTLGFGKEWREGLLQGLSFDVSYTNTIAKDVNPGTSSVATSNYRQVAFADPNNPGLATSNYEIRNLSKLVIEYDHKFFGDNMTRIGLYAQSRSGLPYSYVFTDTSNNTSSAASGMFGYNSLYTNTNAELLYVPQVDPTTHLVTAGSDPRVTYSSTFNFTGFNQFLKNTGLINDAGRIAPRNGFRSRDVTTIDFHFGQELPAFLPHSSKIEAYMDILNLGNMINNHWGVLEQAGFPFLLQPVSAQNCQAGFSPATGKGSCAMGNGNFYQFNSFTFPSQNTGFNATSTWQIKIGFRYKF